VQLIFFFPCLLAISLLALVLGTAHWDQHRSLG
jgi:hypothetical protein